MRIIKVTKDEFTLEDGSVHPICPPLSVDMTTEEFQKHYDFASKVTRGRKDVRSDDEDTQDVGEAGKD